MRKRIGVLLAQIEENTQSRFMTEFIREAYARDYDVCVFSMYQKFQETELRNIGDSNIFQLAPFHLFDAILIMLDTILTPGLADSLQRRIKETFTGPVLVVDHESAFFPSVMMDHYTPVYKLISHLIEEHGYTDIAFLGGKKDHPHSVARLNAYCDCMRDHGLTVKSTRIYHGNYWYDSGEEYVDYLTKGRKKLPQALACANDIMALGAAARLVEKGISIPDQIAVIGYDSIEDGRTSPVPLTSAEIPADECGAYCLKWLHAAMENEPEPEFESKAPLFLGGSCGCTYHAEMVPKKLRSRWTTNQSARGYFSDFNHLIEDLLSVTDYKSFYAKVFDYTYQIRPFHNFYMCLNDNFMYPEQNIGERAIRKGYATKMHQIISCGPDPDGSDSRIDFMNYFDTYLLLPQLYEERDYPTTHIFTPLYFDDRCFGYSVINYGRDIRVYDETYRNWMRNVMQGMEAFYRQQSLQRMLQQINSSQVRDSLTGLYNYRGFLNLSFVLAGECVQRGDEICIIAVDVKGLKNVNEELGRDYGNRVIRVVGRFIQELLDEEEVCSRLGNDEFLIAIPGSVDSPRSKNLLEQLHQKLQEYRLPEADNWTIDFHYGSLSGSPLDNAALESLINHTVGIKNHNKALLRDKHRSEADLTLSEMKRNQVVEHILDNNRLSYYFQPIVRAQDGSIFAYEALMRCEEHTEVGPGDIMRAAVYLNRLYDIEKATIYNVLNYLDRNESKFRDAKVFVNSLPGYQLKGEDALGITDKVNKHKERLVIEFTEESELPEEQLIQFKNSKMHDGIEIALDDYGAGYSNVNNLLRYSPRYVKIDRMLITNIQDSPQKQHFVRSIVEYSHQNSILALAEGVENTEELKAVINLNVDLIQGYYIARPKKEPQPDIDKTIRKEIEHIQLHKKETLYSLQ